MNYYKNKEGDLKLERTWIQKNVILWVVIAILAIAVIYVIFFKGGNGEIDTTGWTSNEIMNYEMHGTIPARAAGSSTSTGSSGGMVGGC